jgi:hypothetical protein
MTQPQSPSALTPAEAIAAVAAAKLALGGDNDIASIAVALSDSVIAARESAAAYAKTLIFALWSDLDPYDGNAVQAFTEAAGGYMATAQTAASRTAGAAQSAMLQSMGVQVPGVASDPTDLRSPGVDVVGGSLVLQRPDSVHVDYGTRDNKTVRAEDMTTVGMFNRPARTFRAIEAQGKPRAEADTAARQRIDSLVEDNVMLAQRFAESEIVQNAVNLDQPDVRIVGYRRVIHPELSRTGVCGLCIAAANQIYKVGTLLPIHTNCKCTIAAVTAKHDPADDVNKADLSALYKLAGGTDGPQLKRIRFQLDEHGELGPTLVPRKQFKPRKQFTRPRRAAAPAKKRDSRFLI